MLFFLTSIFVSSQSLQVNSLRRQQPITIDPQQYENSRSRASFPTWYFVRFHDDDIKNLRNNLENAKIELKSTRMINKHWFSLYLTPSQVKYLSEISDLRQVSTDEKIINPQSLEDAHYLSIEVSHDFIPPSHIKMLLQAENIYRIDYDLSFDFSVLKDRKKDDKDFYKRVGFDETRLTKIANELAQMPQIFSITAHQNPDETNNRAAGYTQKNSRAVTLEGKNKDILHIDRYLQNKGLDGT
ncbi:hypothetical protein TRFO_12315 [Tritrichomonas foetus]|uniref:Uncharacterized protein n=1 Tax=Tritrichomonas foetus TaxID=1144522 RepID=A0A1J4J3M3_9EUKA|nr:hypothetical protein TRFO_12315 [Tritrichomonas foetus]|eukprot:OHS92759.1 hypothetical protein TRFO_12315 [Tritrichomonas foetus]